MQDGSQQTFYVEDYAYSEWGLKGKTSSDISAKAHIDILCAASRLVDSACSKTANVGDNVTFDEFKDLYMMAYDGGASGCTTFRPKALEEKFAKGRGAVLSLRTGETESETEYSGEGEGDSEGLVEGQACFIDPQTGERLCAD